MTVHHDVDVRSQRASQRPHHGFGAAVGVEREWSGHASGPQARFGGIRTFTLLGGLGGLAGWLSVSALMPLAETLAVLMVVAVCGLLFLGYPVALTLAQPWRG